MTYIIAEIGVNHNGDVKIAKRLVDAAKKAGADAVKFQIFIAAEIVSANAPKAEYQQKNGAKGKTQYEMLKQLEVSFADFKVLKAYCKKVGIDFLASVFGLKELEFYVDTLGCNTIKFGSGELTNAPLLLAAARKNANVILSTGMADLKIIDYALGVLAFGYTSKARPTSAAFKKASRKNLAAKVLIMQCTTQYPCPDEAVNLKAMQTIAKKFKIPVGFSDHSNGFGLAAASVALGAEMIEKHFTFDKQAEGPDHKASLDIEEFKQYVNAIRSVEKGLGDGKKIITCEARKIADIACKKIVALKNIKKGEIYSESNITTRRASGKGLKDSAFYDIIGRKANKNYVEGSVING